MMSTSRLRSRRRQHAGSFTAAITTVLKPAEHSAARRLPSSRTCKGVERATACNSGSQSGRAHAEPSAQSSRQGVGLPATVNEVSRLESRSNEHCGAYVQQHILTAAERDTNEKVPCQDVRLRCGRTYRGDAWREALTVEEKLDDPKREPRPEDMTDPVPFGLLERRPWAAPRWRRCQVHCEESRVVVRLYRASAGG
jgi:hypothetical protein